MSKIDRVLIVTVAVIILVVGYSIYVVTDASNTLSEMRSQMAIECSDAGGVNVWEYPSRLVCYNQETGTRIIVPTEIVK